MEQAQPTLHMSNHNAFTMFSSGGHLRLNRRVRPKKWPFLFLTFLLLCGIVWGAYRLAKNSSLDQIVTLDTAVPAEKIKQATLQERLNLKDPYLSRVSDRIRSGESLSAALARHGISGQETFKLAEALRKKLNLRGIQPGDVFVIERQQNPQVAAVVVGGSAVSNLIAFELVRLDSFGVPTRFRAVREDAKLLANENLTFNVTQIETPVVKRSQAIAGKISSSLYEGILYAGGDPTLVDRFSDVFAWQLDFYREAQKGDGFKMIVEARYADGRFIGYGRVLAAEYNNAGRQYRGFYYESADGQLVGTFDEQGNSLERSFLQSPMELTRITSRYGQRFHPVLRKRKRHNGVDYGAPTGTPFWSIADGVVVEARYSPTAGKMIRIRHPNGYMSEYFHASRIAPNIHVGVAVKQRQVIGYVGTTGRSTGPHLHFGMMLNKQYVNPAKQKFPAGKAVPARLVKNYLSKVKPLIKELNQIEAV
ncbi:MAG: peptidoglycan DD-metalloendopeptidase family protein [bacterium]|nr:peptidoglycan DD-metalloendopeptidase family protein [bacterium]